MLQRAKLRMPGSVQLTHTERSKGGYPDFSNIWRDWTSWWEVKFYNNAPFESPENQHIMCRRLDRASFCRYIIFEDRGGLKQVLIVEPEKLDQWVKSEVRTPYFDFGWVANYISEQHMRRLRIT